MTGRPEPLEPEAAFRQGPLTIANACRSCATGTTTYITALMPLPGAEQI